MCASKTDSLTGQLQKFGLARDRMRSAVARAVGMSESDLDALEYLEAEGPLTQRELGDRLSITSGAVTMLVDRLETAGWVRRCAHPSDRRYVLIELTHQAEKKMPGSLLEYHSRIRAIAGKVRAEHKEAAGAFLEAAAEAASATADTLGR